MYFNQHNNQHNNQPFYTYTFDGTLKSPMNEFPIATGSINSSQYVYLKRPILGSNVFKLYKEDIKIIQGDEKRLQVIHPWSMGTAGHVLFHYHDMPDSQDTKSIFTAIAFLGEQSLPKIQGYKKRNPYAIISVMQMDEYGNLS